MSGFLNRSSDTRRPRLVITRPGVKVLAVCGVAGAVVAATIVLAASADARRARAGTAASAKLVARYKPSQPTGWEPPYNRTIGGHVVSKEVTYGKKKYRLALLGFGPANKSPNPVYEAVPSDPKVAFKKTLARAWDRYYAIRYRGALPRGAKFVVESNSVYSTTDFDFGADVYVVYKPGRSRKYLPINSDLQFIQVVYSNAVHPESFVDSMRHNPFYGEGAGLTSIDGNQIVSFYDRPRLPILGKSPRVQVDRFETFLAQDTGKKNSAGKEIVNIYGGVKWGFELRPIG